MKKLFTIALIEVLLLGLLFPSFTKTAKAATPMQAKLNVSPQEVLFGDPVNIVVTGLTAGQIATLIVSGKDQFGNTWSSEASFQADKNGTIDPSRDAPIEGSYRGVDPAGLFWSMVCKPASNMVSPFATPPAFTIALFIDGEEKDQQVVTRIVNHNLDRLEVSDEIVGVFLMPHEISKPTPALIVLGGSEGGVKEAWAAIIASKTRLPTLALGYFGAEGLPPTLENIPLETIEKALNWLARQPNVVSDSFGIIGASRGGELAILAASLFPQIKAVVGYTPSGVIWQGIGSSESPAWTYQGKPFPYLKFMEDEDSLRRFKEAQDNGTPYLGSSSFLYSLKMQSDSLEAATIQVEKSKAAFLLIGNPGDGVWPSDILSKVTIDRLQANNHSRYYELLSYDNGGHMLITYPYYPTTMRQFYLPTISVWEGLGGTAEDAARAARDSWEKVIDFLHRELLTDSD
ncbi:MAG: acyl-CoA thioester hydrolase [Thermotogaceae bacterium]|nr:acyl-CoA thioester hydrolase [Thermotogaceae bacterium]